MSAEGHVPAPPGDFVLPFDLPAAGVRGRLVRLDAASARALSAHVLAEPAARVLGEALTLSVVLERGVRRGDLRRGLDLELALDVLGGALFYRLLVTGGPIDEQLAEGVVELILTGFAPARKRETKKTPTPKDTRS